MEEAPGTCPNAETLAAWATGGLEPGGRLEMDRHVSACASCRALVSDLVPLPARETAGWAGDPLRQRLKGLQPPRRFSPWIPAAAAGLLLCAGWLARAGRHEAPAPATPPPEASNALPRSLLMQAKVQAGGGDREILAARSALLLLKAGGSLERLGDGRIRLQRGLLFVEDPGESGFVVEGAEVRLAGGRLALEVLPPSATAGSLWLRAAHAAPAPSWRVSVLEGSAAVRLGGEERTLGAGEEVRGTGAEAVWGRLRAPESMPVPTGWRLLPDCPRSLPSGCAGVWPGAEGTRTMEAVFRRESATGVSVRIRLPQGCAEVPLGGALVRSGRSWIRLRVLVSAEEVLLQAGEEEILRLPQAQVLRRFPAASGEAGLVCWGEGLEVRSARWRPGELP